MSAYWSSNEAAVAALVARWTVLLALAWIGHRALSGRNPRWRVALWRATVVGLAVVGALAFAPPLVTLPFVPAVGTEIAVEADAAPAMPRRGASDRPLPAPSLRRQGSGPATAYRASLRPSGPDDPANSAGRSSDAAAVLAPIVRPVAAPLWIVPALLGLWAVGVAVLSGELALAWIKLARIIGRANEAPAPVIEKCREVAEALGAPAVHVVCPAEVRTPCLAGLARPVLLLPSRSLADEDVRAVLAHELAHARGHDLAWNLLSHLSTIVLWFHPLAWPLRTAHAAACDAVCDAVAADFVGNVPSYARTLARLALAAFAPPPTPGLAMARSCEIRRRVNALDRRVFRAPCRAGSLCLPSSARGCSKF